MAEPRTVGVIGGMGPEATVDLMQRVIRATPARDDEDHVHMIVDNNPRVPSRIQALIDGTGESPGPFLCEMARGLEVHGADLLAIPCNTAHVYHNEIVSAVSIPVLHMIRLTAHAVMSDAPSSRIIGILASDAIRLTGLYEEEFRGMGAAVLYPRESAQYRIMQTIREVKAGRCGSSERETLQAAAKHLLEQGAGALVVACTELSVVADAMEEWEKVYDAAQILAEAIVAAAT